MEGGWGTCRPQTLAGSGGERQGCPQAACPVWASEGWAQVLPVAQNRSPGRLVRPPYGISQGQTLPHLQASHTKTGHNSLTGCWGLSQRQT